VADDAVNGDAGVLQPGMKQTHGLTTLLPRSR
jgi:hypothetical protein